MRDDQISRIRAAIEKAHALVEGPGITYVSPLGIETELPGLYTDLQNEQGLEIDEAGIRNRGVRELQFRKETLTDLGVTLELTGYFKMDGERWDFAGKEPFMEAIVPIAGIHNLLSVRVQRATELNNTDPSDTFTFAWE